MNEKKKDNNKLSKTINKTKYKFMADQDGPLKR